MRKQHPLVKAHDLYELAATYINDGAFFTAAERLEECAKLIRQHAEKCVQAERGDD